jgi:hypothetical protein
MRNRFKGWELKPADENPERLLLSLLVHMECSLFPVLHYIYEPEFSIV